MASSAARLVPLVRPNEALLVLLMAGAMAGGYVRAVRGAPLQLRLRPWDVPLAAFVLLATVWPISSMLLRGMPPLPSDVIAVLPACKLAGLLLLVRTTVRTPTQVLWCIRLIIGGAVGIAAVAILQILSIGPVLALLDTWWPIDPGGSLDDAWHGDARERDCHRRLHRDRPDAACHVRGPWPAW